jgi:hypothetical protein
MLARFESPNFAQVNVPKPRRFKNRSVKVRPTKSRPVEVRPDEPCLFEVCSEEKCIAEVRVTETSPAEIGIAEKRYVEVRSSKVRPNKDCPIKVRPGEVNLAEVRSSKVCLSKICPSEIWVYADVRDYFAVFVSPSIPCFHSLLQLCEVFWICHRVPLLSLSTGIAANLSLLAYCMVYAEPVLFGVLSHAKRSTSRALNYSRTARIISYRLREF